MGRETAEKESGSYIGKEVTMRDALEREIEEHRRHIMS